MTLEVGLCFEQAAMVLCKAHVGVPCTLTTTVACPRICHHVSSGVRGALILSAGNPQTLRHLTVGSSRVLLPALPAHVCLCVVFVAARCTTLPPKQCNANAFAAATCPLPAASGSSACTASCATGFSANPDPAITATCTKGEWSFSGTCAPGTAVHHKSALYCTVLYCTAAPAQSQLVTQ
jgi:hypothetical protein